MIRWKDFRDLQRRAAEETAVWRARGAQVYTEADELVAQTRDAATAARIVEKQNTFMVLCNLIVWLARKLKDAKDLAQGAERSRAAKAPARAQDTTLGH